MPNFELIRNANIEAVKKYDRGDNPKLSIVINGKYEHEFGSRDKESQFLEYAHPEQVAQRLNGGTFFVVDGDLVDYRDENYRGFIHDEDGIEKLAEHVGLSITKGRSRTGAYSQAARGTNQVFNRSRHRGLSRGIQLGGSHGEFAFNVEQLGDGGKFNTNLMFGWSPFSDLVSSVVEVLRLVCENGMVGMSPIINSQIPIINNHKEHLEIAANQIEHRFSSIMKDRLLEMADSRTSVAVLKMIRDEAVSRLRNQEYGPMRDRLGQIASIADPYTHLREFYTEAELGHEDRRHLLDGHLTEFDALNLMTELDSHTIDPSEGTRDARQRHNSVLQSRVNSLVFDARSGKKAQHQAALSRVPLSRESDPERAFFAAAAAA